MPNRVLREGIIDSRAINSLSESSELFYRRLMSIVDDFGRFEADLELIRVKAFGRRLDDWSLTRVSEALTDVSRVLTDDGHPLVTVYSLGHKKYLQINNFGQRLRSATSKFPPPPTDGGDPPPGGGHMTAIGQTDDGHPQASRAQARSESETKSESESEAEAKSEGSARKPNEPTILDDFGQFQELCALAQMSCTAEDLNKSRLEWRVLDFQQKLAAVKGIRDRIACGEFADSGFRPLPQNYLKEHRWNRPLRNKSPTANGSAKPIDEAAREFERRKAERSAKR